jgi:hypothetical protein
MSDNKRLPLSASKRRPALDLLSQSKKASSTGNNIRIGTDVKKLSGSDRLFASAIEFGKPSSTGSSAKTPAGNGPNWESLLKGARNGFSSKLFGGGLLGFGLSSLFSGISDLIGGGKKEEAPLQRFSLPDPQNATLYQANGKLDRVQVEASTPANPTGVYSNKNASVSQASVVHAVKQALLTSSSLNDIIGDL